MKRIPLENLEKVAKLLAISNAPFHVKESILETVKKFVEDKVEERVLRLRVSWLATFSFKPNLEIIRMILKLLGLKTKPLENWSSPGEVYARLAEYESKISKAREALGLVGNERLKLDQILRINQILSLEE